MNATKRHKQAVLTGAAGGLGQALCRALTARGFHVYALDLPSQALSNMAGPAITPLGLDLTDSGQINHAVQQILSACDGVDLVLHCAGVSHIRAFADSSVESHRKVMEINHFAAVALTKALLPAVRAAHGVHLAISSVAGFAPLYHRTAYAASKHAMEGFFKSLRSEEAAYGVDVLIAAPSFIATNPGRPESQADGTTRPGAATDGFDQMSAEEAAAVILKGYDKRRGFIPVGRVARLSALLNRLSPAFYERQMRRKTGA